jgi:hypothetical protein
MTKRSDTPDESKMGSPANGFCKPYIPFKLEESSPLTVAQAVARYGDDWRLFLDKSNGFRKAPNSETVTQDRIEAIHMNFMERGLRARVRIDYE